MAYGTQVLRWVWRASNGNRAYKLASFLFKKKKSMTSEEASRIYHSLGFTT